MQNHNAHSTPSSPSLLMGTVMKGWARHGLQISFLFAVAFCGGLQSQVAASQQNDGATATSGSTASSDQPNPPAGNIRPDATYIIGDEDVLSINVWKELDLTKVVPVRSDGRISLPLVGEVQAAGLTPAQLEQELKAALRGYISDPQVTVIVQEIKSRNFNILGQVTKPGSYPLTADTTIVDAIALAGGFRDFAKKKGIYVIRQDANGRETRLPFNYENFIKGKNKGKNTAQNIQLKPHDTIVVP